MADDKERSSSEKRSPRQRGERQVSPRVETRRYVVSGASPPAASILETNSTSSQAELSEISEENRSTTDHLQPRSSLERESDDGGESQSSPLYALLPKRGPIPPKVYTRSVTSVRIGARSGFNPVSGTPNTAVEPALNGRGCVPIRGLPIAALRRDTSPSHMIRPLLLNGGLVIPPGGQRHGLSQSPTQASPFLPPTALDAILASIENQAPSTTRERSNSEPFINSWSYHSASPIVPITHPQLRRNGSKRGKTVRQASLVFRDHPKAQPPAPAARSTYYLNHNSIQNTSSSSGASMLSPTSSSASLYTPSSSSSDIYYSAQSGASLSSTETTVVVVEKSPTRRRPKDKSSERSLKSKDKDRERDKDKDKERDKDKDKDKEKKRKKSSTRDNSAESDTLPYDSSTIPLKRSSDGLKSGSRKGNSRSTSVSDKDRLKLQPRSQTLNLSNIESQGGSDSPMGSPTSVSAISTPNTPKSNDASMSEESEDWAPSPSSPRPSPLNNSPSGRYLSKTSYALDTPSISSMRSDSAPGQSQRITPSTTRRSPRQSRDSLDDVEYTKQRIRAKSGSEGVYYTDTEGQKIRKRPKHSSGGSTLSSTNIEEVAPPSSRKTSKNKKSAEVGVQVPARPRVVPAAIWLSNKVDESQAKMFFEYLQAHFKDSQLCEAVILMHSEIVCSRYLLDNLLSLYASAAEQRQNQQSQHTEDPIVDSTTLARSSVPALPSPSSLSSHSSHQHLPQSSPTSPSSGSARNYSSQTSLNSPTKSSPTTYESDYEPGQAHRQKKSKTTIVPPTVTRPTKPPSDAVSTRYSSLRQGTTGGVSWADVSAGSSSGAISPNSSSKRTVSSQSNQPTSLQLAPSILQTSILNFLKKWVRLNTQDFIDDSILQDMVRDFVNELRRKPGIECQMGGLIWDLFESSLHKLDDDPNVNPLTNYDVLLLLGKASDGITASLSAREIGSPHQANQEDDTWPIPPSSPTKGSQGSSSSAPVSTKLKPVAQSVSASSISSSSSSSSNNTAPNSLPITIDAIPEYLFKFTEFPSPILGREAMAVIQANASLLTGTTGNASISVMDVSPLELARQWCLLDHTVFSQVRFRDFLRFASNPEDCASLDRLSHGFNHATSWVAYQILRVENPKKRARVVVHMISVAEELLALNNFHAFFGVIIGLTQLSIARLRATWKQVGKKELKMLRSLQELASPINNFAGLRNAHDATPPPFVPLPALFLRDLVMLTEASHDGFINPENNTVNVDKILMIEKLLGRLHSAQRNHYRFVPLKSIQDVLLQGIAVASEELEAWSARVEPANL